ncbi:hypothetical protein FOIG_06152 [Fusarium odoratissimum NRRL 54006]|uniref:Uncharacterized protein n=2 Tax=Fusarium oxysporum species complex TaxID=171631 RepID=X0K3N5_FUSO5|nr:uncharacterized protein FOIG_06152 [Fusarium odoratissimum NRRL 54006]EXM03302.1 hypothetical protein FOIG_06152 [Fusarium odoratissimum NRRL 54006]TXC11976.1 hypothetical protein FocTR4_00007392 [Fusarium oxysporum f. sp. cubense]
MQTKLDDFDVCVVTEKMVSDRWFSLIFAQAACTASMAPWLLAREPQGTSVPSRRQPKSTGGPSLAAYRYRTVLHCTSPGESYRVSPLAQKTLHDGRSSHPLTY